MPDSIDVTNQVRLSRGLDPLPNPYVIQGDGAFPAPRVEVDYLDDPILPRTAEREAAIERRHADLTDDFGHLLVDPSPLVTLGARESQREPELPMNPAMVAPLAMPILGLMVADRAAAYEGRTVELTESERAAVAKVVIQAIARTLDEQLGAVRALLPRRKPRPGLARQEGKGTAKQVPTAPDREPRKRGRPKKNPA